eukprot:11393730-Alexandrium_andersonii.AAC.1
MSASLVGSEMCIRDSVTPMTADNWAKERRRATRVQAFKSPGTRGTDNPSCSGPLRRQHCVQARGR